MTTSPSKAKGSRFERDVVKVFRSYGFDAKRNYAQHQDRRDIVGVTFLSIECKDHANLALASWVDEARQEAVEGTFPIVVHKRRGRSAPRAYVTLSLEDLVQLIVMLRERT